MIGAIVLTHRKRGGVRTQNISKQNQRRPQDATRLVDPGVGQGWNCDFGRPLSRRFGSAVHARRARHLSTAKNIIVILMAIELILLAVNINLVAFSAALGDLVGQVFAMFVLTVARAKPRSASPFSSFISAAAAPLPSTMPTG